MKVSVQEISPIERSVEVQVDSAKVQQAYDKHLNDLVRNVAIPGFRKGKAPRKLAERYANRQALNETVFRDVGVPAYERAIEQQKLAPLGQPNLELVQLEPGKDLIFKATFEIRPEITVESKEWEGIEVEYEHSEIDEDSVSAVLEDMRKKGERMVGIDEKRPLQKGDVAVVDFDSREGDTPLPNGQAENFTMDVDDEFFVEGFADRLVGMNVDEKRTFDFPFPEDYGNKSLAGKTVTFDVTLKDIKKRELPELDDDLATEVSNFKTLAELKESIRKRLETNRQAEIGNHALEALAKKKEMLVPKAYVQQMVSFMLENQARQLAQMGINFEDFMKHRGLSAHDLFHELQPQGELMARAEMLVDAIAREQKIEVSNDELDAEIKSYAENTQQEYDDVKKTLTERKQTEAFRADVMRRRVLELLAKSAKVVKPRPAEEKSEEGGAAGSTQAGETATDETASEARPKKSKAKEAKAEKSEPAAEASNDAKSDAKEVKEAKPKKAASKATKTSTEEK